MRGGKNETKKRRTKREEWTGKQMTSGEKVYREEWEVADIQ